MKNISVRLSKGLILPAGMFILAFLCTQGRFDLNFITVLLSQMVLPTVLGFGFCLVLISGLFDLSTGSAVLFACILGAFIGSRFGTIGLLISCVISGMLVGTLTASIYTVLRMPSMVVTMGLALIYEILPFKIGIAGNPRGTSIDTTLTTLGRFPYNLIILAVTAALFLFVTTMTPFFKHVRAVGGDETLAKTSGIDPRKTKFLMFILAGLFFGIASFLQLTYAGSVQNSLNMASVAMIFQPMMGVLIALELTAIYPLTLGIIISEFCLGVLFSGLVAMGMPSVTKNVMLGIFLLIVMSNKVVRENIRDALRRRKLKGQALDT